LLQLICLRETWEQMSSVSGFDPLFTAIENNCNCGVQNYFISQLVSRKSHIIQRVLCKLSFTHADKTSGYRINPFVGERHENIAAKIVRDAEQNSNALVLLSAGENQYAHYFITASDSVRKRIVIVLHQPPSWLRLHWRDFSALNGLGAIICLSKEQMEFISGITSTPTILIKHGVCHDFFRPDPVKEDKAMPHLLFVGQWLRDFDTLAMSMELVWREQPGTLLDCVIPMFARNHPALLRLARDKRVTWHADITPEALCGLYQQSTLLFLPLIDATANNSIVEALASGLPIISSKVGGIFDYVSQNTGELCPAGDIQAHAEAVLRLLPNKILLEEARLTCRNIAENDLNWGQIACNLAIELERISQ